VGDCNKGVPLFAGGSVEGWPSETGVNSLTPCFNYIKGSQNQKTFLSEYIPATIQASRNAMTNNEDNVSVTNMIAKCKQQKDIHCTCKNHDQERFLMRAIQDHWSEGNTVVGLRSKKNARPVRAVVTALYYAVATWI
jgi:hypothetical protein